MECYAKYKTTSLGSVKLFLRNKRKAGIREKCVKTIAEDVVTLTGVVLAEDLEMLTLRNFTTCGRGVLSGNPSVGKRNVVGWMSVS